MGNQVPFSIPLPLPEIFASRFISISEKIMDCISHLDFEKMQFFSVSIFDENKNQAPDVKYYGSALAKAKDRTANWLRSSGSMWSSASDIEHWLLHL
ncbi:MAG: hypothetical protein ABJ327_26300 [Litoreibacter sp.]